MSHSPERPDDLGWLLAKVSYSLTTELTAALESLSVTPRAQCVLATAMQGEYTQTALAQAIGLDKTTMVVTIDALERAGLVERRTSSEDRRARVIAVTEAGAATVAEGEQIVEQIHEDVLSALSPERREAFMDALRQLATDRLGAPTPCEKPVRRREPRSVAAAAV
ncbi:MAG TPA: MarR family winged helix-turn-helix transcriptional regulator [Solirubrobacteraceae bacterium]|nr:MarR family winged helix-turn-helix transcriptional regulator [Solirubrobacteraceae bacterium]